MTVVLHPQGPSRRRRLPPALAAGVGAALLLLATSATAQPRKPKPADKPATAAPAPAPAPAAAPTPADTAKAGGKPKVFDFTGLDIAGRLRTPQLLYFLDRASEELERASLERRSFVPEMVRSIDESRL